MRLKDKVAIVTGAAHGIGLAIATLSLSLMPASGSQSKVAHELELSSPRKRGPIFQSWRSWVPPA